ncbi:MAG: SCO family protein [Myxococcales bacterium]|jgi:protein SCO1/2
MRRCARSLLALSILAVLPLVVGGCRKPEPLPRIAQVPAFELDDQDAEAITAESLRGKVWVANFMFTSCPDVCPLLTAKMLHLRTELRPVRDAMRFVSFSVDPDTDTPQVLRKYAEEQGANQPDWRFLTGPLDRVKDVIVGGFKQNMQQQPAEPGEPPNIMHGSHFVLVDRELTIRGFYRSDDVGLKRLARDARRLVAGKADG